MKNRFMKLLRLLCGAFILTTCATVIMLSVSDSENHKRPGVAWALYILTYILYPKIIPKKKRTTEIKNIFYFTLIYSVFCLFLLLFI